MDKKTILGRFGATILAVSLAGGCSFPKIYRGVEPTSPELGYSFSGSYQVIDTLQPRLEWEESAEQGETYDLAIWEAPGQGVSRAGGSSPYPLPSDAFYRQGESTSWGTLVYLKEDLRENYHTVEEPLKPTTLYAWSVRLRKDNQATDWSSFVQHIYYGFFSRRYSNAPYGFSTP